MARVADTVVVGAGGAVVGVVVAGMVVAGMAAVVVGGGWVVVVAAGVAGDEASSFDAPHAAPGMMNAPTQRSVRTGRRIVSMTPVGVPDQLSPKPGAEWPLRVLEAQEGPHSIAWP